MKKLINFLIIIITFALIMPLLTGCEEKEDTLGDIELPPTPLVVASESCGVIETAYLRLRERPDVESRIVTTLWRGYVLEIMSRSPSRDVVEYEEDFWYQVNYDGLQGWVFGSNMTIYTSKEEAQRKARAVRSD
ncbi:MAG: SH3 domain-containing protein [Spirochaetales bacterium]|nr:SH3 domain-containing protein [Spirochaetales bacterium]